MTSYVEPRRARPGARPAGWWGMLGLVATEAVLFGCLFASYYYLRFKSSPAWPPDGIPDPRVLDPSISTAILVSSSVAALVAASARGRRSRPAATLGLVYTLVVASVFLWRQAEAYALAVEDFTPQTNAYGSLFYTITGAHAVHVFAGILLTLGTLFVVWTGAYGRRSRIAVLTTSLYWHFTNAVAVAVLVLVYLVPALT